MQQKSLDQLMNAVNVLILLVITLIYVVTGTRLGDDAIAALSRGTVYRGRENGAVAVECVVNWDAENLVDMLDVLKAQDTKITFFVSGKWARAHASTLQRMAADGHEIGSCGYEPFLDGSVGMVAQDVTAAGNVIASITGTAPRSYHAGLRDRTVSARAAERLNLTHVAATSDLLSGRGEAGEIVLRASEQAFDGSILLIQPTAAAAEALPELLAAIREMGFAVTTVGEVLKGKTV